MFVGKKRSVKSVRSDVKIKSPMKALSAPPNSFALFLPMKETRKL